MKEIQNKIDNFKETKNSNTETLKTFDKQLDRINEKKDTLTMDRERLQELRDELQDKYYGDIITQYK